MAVGYNSADMGWLETISIAFTKREPKTPMSFYNRLLLVIAVMIVAPLYANIEPAYKSTFLIVGIAMAVILAVWVSLFAWFRPKYLLYGAESHFEEWKIERKQASSGKTLPPRASHDLSENVVSN